MFFSKSIRGYNVKIKLAAELEVLTTLDSGRKPFPFRHRMVEHSAELAQYGIGFELGYCQAELHSCVSDSGAEVACSLSEGLQVLRDLLPENGHISMEQYVPEFAVPGLVMLWDQTLSVRHRAILSALRKEEPDNWGRVGKIGAAQSLQYHVSLHDADGTPWSFDPREVTEASECANLLVNYLNAVAPHFAYRIARRYRLPDPSKRIRLWFEYCTEWRKPQYRWHTRESRIAWFDALPRLVGCKLGTSGEQEGDWELLPSCGSEVWDVVDAGLQRDLARLSPPRANKPWTIEFRPLSTLREMEWVAEVGDELVEIVRLVCEYVTSEGVDAPDLFRVLSGRFGTLPTKKPTCKDWIRQIDIRA